jgi:hypothetical protein
MRAGNSVPAPATRLDVERSAESETSARAVGWDLEQSLHTEGLVAAKVGALDPVGEKLNRATGQVRIRGVVAEPVATS